MAGRGQINATGPRCVCGKVTYKSRSGAREAARKLHTDKRPYECDVTVMAGVWHLGTLAPQVLSGEKDRRDIYEKSDAEINARMLVGNRSHRGCETCGSPGFEFSHRRTRAIKDDHEWCPCNAANSCRACHEWLHRHPIDAKVLGLMVSRYEPVPGSVPVRLKTGWCLLRCDGTITPLRPNQVEVEHGRPVLVR